MGLPLHFEQSSAEFLWKICGSDYARNSRECKSVLISHASTDFRSDKVVYFHRVMVPWHHYPDFEAVGSASNANKRLSTAHLLGSRASEGIWIPELG